MLRPKKNSYKEFDNEKKIPAAQKFPSPHPHNFSNGPSLTSKNTTYFWTFPESYQGSMISNVNLFSIMINVFKSTKTSNVFVFAPKR